jgi:hypothetical protein
MGENFNKLWQAIFPRRLALHSSKPISLIRLSTFFQSGSEGSATNPYCLFRSSPKLLTARSAQSVKPVGVSLHVLAPSGAVSFAAAFGSSGWASIVLLGGAVACFGFCCLVLFVFLARLGCVVLFRMLLLLLFALLRSCSVGFAF